MLLHAFIASAVIGQCANYSVQRVAGSQCPLIGQQGALGYGLSESGYVVGAFLDCNSYEHPFIWSGSGPIQPIVMPPGFPNGRAFAVNDMNVVVGEMQDAISSSPARAFAAFNGVAIDLGLLPNANTAEALAINASNTVVGYSQHTWTGPLRPFRWQGAMLEFGVLPGADAVANNVNALNQICGWVDIGVLQWRPFLWQNDVSTMLPFPAPALSAMAMGINNLGDVCGWVNWPGPDGSYIRHACAWIDGQFIDLGTLAPFEQSRALDINDAREIVGHCWSATAGAAVIWRNGTIANLNTLMPAGNVYLNIAHAINNRGQITGDSQLSSSPHTAFAFLLTPALPATPGDTNCDGLVNINDLLAVINVWGMNPAGGTTADLNRDNRIDVNDLLAVISHWS